MESVEWKILTAIFLIGLAAILLFNSFGDESKGAQVDLTISSLSEKNEVLNRYRTDSGECSSGIGQVRVSGTNSLRILTFNEQVIGVQRSWDKNNNWKPWADQPEGKPDKGAYTHTVFFKQPPSEEECRTGKWETDSSASANLSWGSVKALNPSLKHYSRVHNKCGYGVPRKPDSHGLRIFTFDGYITAIQTRWPKEEGWEPWADQRNQDPVDNNYYSQTLKLRNSPSIENCISDASKIEEDGVKTLNCYSKPCKQTEITKRPETCGSWHRTNNITPVQCNWTKKNIEDVSFIADPVNYVDSDIYSGNLSTEIYTAGLSDPWDLNFLPNGSAIITEQRGEVLIWDPSEKTARSVGSVDAKKFSTAGLMGVAVDPKFSTNRKIYLHYTYEFPKSINNGEIKWIRNKIVKYTLRNGSIKEEETLIKQIPGINFHAGGRLEFGPDNYLYTTTGDGRESNMPRKLSYLGGKVLRFDRNGTPVNTISGNSTMVYSRGHRNPQGLAWQPETEDLYTSEHGPWREDEINRVKPGGDYGWNKWSCEKVKNQTLDAREGYEKPLWCSKNWTLAPSGATFVNDSDHPWHGDLFVASLRSKHLHRFEIEDGEIISDDVFWFNKDTRRISQRIRDVEYRNGSLWLLGDSGGIVKLSPA